MEQKTFIYRKYIVKVYLQSLSISQSQNDLHKVNNSKVNILQSQINQFTNYKVNTKIHKVKNIKVK